MDFITTSNGFEGYEIKKYCGICTGECVLGTGFLSSLDASISDLFGVSSASYEGKLTQAKEAAIGRMRDNARQRGANGIIGVDIDYTTFTNDVMGVVVSGTAVVVEKSSAQQTLEETMVERKSIFVSNITLQVPVRPLVVNIFASQDKLYANVEAIVYVAHSITDMKVKLSFSDAFQDEAQSVIVALNDFQIVDQKLTSSIFALDITNVDALSNVSVEILKYIDNGSLVESSNESVFVDAGCNLEKIKTHHGVDAFWEYTESEQGWRCVCGTNNQPGTVKCTLCQREITRLQNMGLVPIQDTIKVLSQMANAREIYNYIIEHKPFGAGDMQEEVEKKAEYNASFERMYGNAHGQCMKQIQKVIQDLTE